MEKDLKNRAITSTFWKLFERILAQTVSLVVSIVIARILDPSDYFAVGVVTIFFTFANVFISGGFNTALIQKKNADKDDYSSALFISVLISIIAYLLLFLGAPYIATAYNQPLLVSIIRVMGLTLPVTAIKSIWCAYISSNLQFKKFFFSTLGGTLASAVVGIVMAVKGYGAWALVAQQMTNMICDTLILIITTRIQLVFRISFAKLKELFMYGWKIFVSTLIGTIYAEVTPLIIGLRFNATDLSFYTKGKSFPAILSSTANNTLSAVLFPVLAKCQDDKEKVLKGTRLFMRLCSFIVFPVLLGFFAISNNFITIVLTAKWSESVYYIKLFCVVSMFDIVAIGNCETIKAIGRSDIYLILDIIKKGLYFAVLFIFIAFSSSPHIMALSAIICAIIQIVVNCVPNIKLIGYKLSCQIADLIPALISSVLMCVMVSLIGRISVNIYCLTIIQIILGAISYIMFSYIINRDVLNYAIHSVRDIIQKK